MSDCDCVWVVARFPRGLAGGTGPDAVQKQVQAGDNEGVDVESVVCAVLEVVEEKENVWAAEATSNLGVGRMLLALLRAGCGETFCVSMAQSQTTRDGFSLQGSPFGAVRPCQIDLFRSTPQRNRNVPAMPFTTFACRRWSNNQFIRALS